MNITTLSGGVINHAPYWQATSSCVPATGCNMTDEERVQMLRVEVLELLYVLCLIANHSSWFAGPLRRLAESVLRRPGCPAMAPEFEGQRDAWLRGR